VAAVAAAAQGGLARCRPPPPSPLPAPPLSPCRLHACTPYV
jgi:hypothetical protein